MANGRFLLLPLMLLIVVQLQRYLVTTTAVGKRLGGGWLLSSREDSADCGNLTGGGFGRARNNESEAIIQF